MNKLQNIFIILFTLFILLGLTSPTYAKTFKIATYNVENLFDLQKSGTEYIEYIPNNIFNWNANTLTIKLNNIAQVIKDLNADIIALQEIESERALDLLQDKLKEYSFDYAYARIANKKNTVVKCAVLSRYPIFETKEIPVNHRGQRNIFKVTININSYPLILYINHWKSKRGPESLRIKSAQALRKDINTLDSNTDFILLGDFNSNYNEHKSIKRSKRLNDTKGQTGINHVLKTTVESEMITEDFLIKQTNNKYLYNLWLEIDSSKRWSYKFIDKPNTPDSILLSPGLYDEYGISYIDNSFDRFTPDYLFKQEQIFRWQKDKKRHLGYGYSDHLPLFADFSIGPFILLKENHLVEKDEKTNVDKNKKPIAKQGSVDLNTATKEELMSIKGIGTTLSDRIITTRPYSTIDDLIKIKGIGEKKLESIRKHFRIQEK